MTYTGASGWGIDGKDSFRCLSTWPIHRLPNAAGGLGLQDIILPNPLSVVDTVTHQIHAYTVLDLALQDRSLFVRRFGLSSLSA